MDYLNSVRFIKDIIASISVALGLVITQYCQTTVLTVMRPKSLTYLASLLLIAIISLFLRYFLEWLFHHSSFIKRLLMPMHDVEGYWGDRMLDGNKLHSYGHTLFSMKNFELRFTGWDYPAGQTDSSYYRYSIDNVVQSDDTINYSWINNSKSDKIEGYGHLTFEPSIQKSHTYNGMYTEIETGKKVKFKGWKIDKKTHKKLIQSLEKGEEKELFPLLKSFLRSKSSYFDDAD